jgi:hypothetical protein
MNMGFRLSIGSAIVSVAFCVCPASAQKLEATVLYRQSSATNYSALVPGYSATGAVDCAADIANQACSEPAADMPGEHSIDVTGTTLSLLLPDGRVAVVNCLNKYSYKRTGLDSRSCAMPLVEHVEADFSGSSAKLKWPVSTDGKKSEFETYKIVALLAKR